ncbi:MAG: hypothetical protein LBE82_11590 [Chitinophagaceae bacterium]|jgi:hypothetical protein|nr:hypothetical protein [Chitinophagaceae bacterium]
MTTLTITQMYSVEVATKDFVTKEIANSKADIIKWMFIFWIGQIAVLTGIIFAILSLYFKK